MFVNVPATCVHYTWYIFSKYKLVKEIDSFISPENRCCVGVALKLSLKTLSEEWFNQRLCNCQDFVAYVLYFFCIKCLTNCLLLTVSLLNLNFSQK